MHNSKYINIDVPIYFYLTKKYTNILFEEKIRIKLKIEYLKLNYYSVNLDSFNDVILNYTEKRKIRDFSFECISTEYDGKSYINLPKCINLCVDKKHYRNRIIQRIFNI
jgi:hypothetical protein